MARFTEAMDFAGQVNFLNGVAFNGATSSGKIQNTDVADDAAIAATKQVHRHPLRYAQADGSDVASETELIWTVIGAATLQRAVARVTTAPTGGDKQFTIDIQYAVNGSSSWTSLLASGAVTVDSSDVDDTNINLSLIADPSVATLDSIRVVITASGSTGSQGQGLVISMDLDENPS